MHLPIRIDAHQHVWRLARGDYAWLTPALAPIYRDYSIDDLKPHLALHGIDATVLVQAAPTVEETEFLLAEARASGGIVRGVVGWVDLAGSDAIPHLERLAREPLLKSIRPMLQDIPDADWILRPDVRSALDALPQLGLRFDALVKPPQLPALLKMLDRHPDLEVVIDHGAKPEIAAGRWEPWAAQIAQAARDPRVYCKLSGLVTEAAPDWRDAALLRYVDHLLVCFGPQRLIWGSDWPVVELGGGYDRWLASAVALLQDLPVVDQSDVFGENALRFYGLEG